MGRYSTPALPRSERRHDDARLRQCGADRSRDVGGARGIAVNADGVDVQVQRAAVARGDRSVTDHGGGPVGGPSRFMKDRPSRAPQGERSIRVVFTIGESLGGDAQAAPLGG